MSHDHWHGGPAVMQGNRVKNSSCKLDLPDSRRPKRRLFGGGGWNLSPGSSDQVEGHVLDGGEVGGCVIGADAAFIIAENHIQDPVKAVLDHPMSSDSRPDLGSDPGQRGDIETRLALDCAGGRWPGEFALALDHDDAAIPAIGGVPAARPRRGSPYRFWSQCGRGQRRRFDAG
jgi:hypothetical protein